MLSKQNGSRLPDGPMTSGYMSRAQVITASSSRITSTAAPAPMLASVPVFAGVHVPPTTSQARLTLEPRFALRTLFRYDRKVSHTAFHRAREAGRARVPR